MNQALVKQIVKKKNAYIFLIPAFAMLLTFNYYTFFKAIIESFFNWNGANVNEFVGFDNYIKLFQDKIFWGSMANVGIITIFNICISVSIPLGAAMMVFACKNQKVSNFFKVLYIVPMVVPSMVTFLLWKWMYAYDTGVVNQILRLIGMDDKASAWLGTPNTALGAIIFIGFPFVAKYGLQFLVYLGALLNIPVDVIESSRLDGITTLQNIFYIQIPLVKSKIRLFIILAIIQSIQSFEIILVLTEGGPGRSTMVPALYLYQQAFNYSNMGYASTIGTVLFVLILGLTMLNNKIGKEKD